MINRPIANLVVFSDNFGSCGGYIEDGSESSSSHPKINMSNFVGPTYPAQHMVDPGPTEAHRDELGTHIFINLFRSMNSREP